MSLWPRLPWDKLEDWGFNLQVAKTAVAAGLSWGLAGWLDHVQRPYFAPLAAILTLQVTIAQTVSRAIQRVVGVVAGIVVAFVITRWLGLHALSVTLTVLVALIIANRLKLGAQGIPQVAISALLVMSVGSRAGYAMARIVDTLLGVAVAVVVNAVVVPPDYTPQAADSLKLLSLALGEVVGDIGRDLVSGLPVHEAERDLTRARAIDQALHRARRAIRRAEQSLKWNFLSRGRKRRLKHLRTGIAVLDHASSQVRGIARTLFITRHRNVEDPVDPWARSLSLLLSRVLEGMAQALVVYAQVLDCQDPVAANQLEKMLEQAGNMREQLSVQAGQLLTEVDSTNALVVIDLAAVISDLEKMAEDLMVSARVLVPLVVPSSSQ